MANIAPIPWYVPLIQLDPKGKPLPTYGLSKEFGNWLQTSLVSGIANAPTIYTPVSLTGQSASIPLTQMPLPALATGFYSLTYYAEITTVDAVSSALQIAVSFTHNTKSLNFTGLNITGNTTTTIQTNTWSFQIDQSSPVSYSTTYTSNTPGQMKYSLILVLTAL